MFPRSAGLLLHVTSLPGGRLGADALAFVDFCAAARQRWWQMLPVHPPGPHGTPYAALSAFAGSEALVEEPVTDSGFRPFLERNRDWLPDYALFRALKDSFGGAAWVEGGARGGSRFVVRLAAAPRATPMMAGGTAA